MPEQLPRPQRRALQREDEQYIGLPLNIDGHPRRLEAQVRHLVKLLRSAQSPSPCSDAVEHVLTLHGRTATAAARGGLACRRGCAHCCYQRVTVTAPEAFYIARQIQRDETLKARLLDAHQQTAGMSDDARWRSRTPCPFLADDACAIYARRPVSCRGVVSLDVARCISAYVELNADALQIPGDHLYVMNAMRTALGCAMKIAGLPLVGYELNGAVARVLTTPEAERRWLNGEAIFDGVDVDTGGSGGYRATVDQLAAHIAPTC